MKNPISVYFILLALSTLTMACKGGEGVKPQFKIGDEPTGTNSESSGSFFSSSFKADRTYDDQSIFAGAGASFDLKLTKGFASKCDEKTRIEWVLAASAEQATLDNSDTCSPTLTTTEAFSGEASITARAVVDGEKIQFDFLLEKKSPPEIDFTNSDSRRDFLEDQDWDRLVVADPGVSTANWLVTHNMNVRRYGTRETIELYVCDNELDCQGEVHFRQHDRKINREFAMVMDDVITNPDEKDAANSSKYEVSFECEGEPYSDTGFNPIIECPLEFEPFSHENPELRFRFRLSDRPSNRGENTDGVNLVNVYRHGAYTGARLNMYVSVKHPHEARAHRHKFGHLYLNLSY